MNNFSNDDSQFNPLAAFYTRRQQVEARLVAMRQKWLAEAMAMATPQAAQAPEVDPWADRQASGRAAPRNVLAAAVDPVALGDGGNALASLYRTRRTG